MEVAPASPPQFGKSPGQFPLPAAYPGVMHEPTDTALVKAIRKRGDREAMAALLTRHARAIYSTAYRILRNAAAAEDAAQETFLTLLRIIPASTGNSVGAWIHGVTVRTALKQRSRGFLRGQKEGAAGMERMMDRTRDDPRESAERREIEARVGELGEDLRIPLILHYYQGLSVREVAEALDCPKTTVANRLQEARDRLKGVLAVGAMAAFLARLGDARGAIDQLEPPAGLLGRIHPLVDASAPVSTLPALQKGALVLMTTKKVLTLVAVALLLGGISWQVLKPPPSRTSSPPGDRQPARPGHPPAPPVAAEVTPASPSAGQPQPDAVQTATLTGRVTDRETLLPVPGAKIMLVNNEQGKGTTLTDAAGRYSLTTSLLVDTQHWLRVEAEGYYGESCMGVYPPLQEGEKRVLDIDLAPPVELIVHLLDIDGRPIDHGNVLCRLEATIEGEVRFRPCFMKGGGSGIERVEANVETGEFPPYTYTNLSTWNTNFTDNTLKIEVSPTFPLAKSILRIEACSPGRSYAPSAPLDLSGIAMERRPMEVWITLTPGLSLSGTVLDPSGTPFQPHKPSEREDEQGLPSLTCWPDGMDEQTANAAGKYWGCRMERDGTFTIEGLPSDVETFQLLLEGAEPWGYAMSDPVKVHAGPGATLRLSSTGLEIYGRVVDAEGRPVETLVQMCTVDNKNDRRTRTDPDGRFVFKGIPTDLRVSLLTFPPEVTGFEGWGGDDVRGYRPGEKEASIPPTGWKDVPAGITGLEIVLGKEPGLKAYRP